MDIKLRPNIAVSLGADGTCMVTQRYYRRIMDGSVQLDVSDVPGNLLIPQPPVESSGDDGDYFPEDDVDPILSDSYPESSPLPLIPEVTDPSPKRPALSPVKYNDTDYIPEYVCQVSIIECLLIPYFYFASFSVLPNYLPTTSAMMT